MKVPHSFIKTSLCILVFLLTSVNGFSKRHVIVSYDISASMVSQKMKMGSKDIERLNRYLMSILYEDIQVKTQNSSDSITQEYEGESTGPLLTEGDLLSLMYVATSSTMVYERMPVTEDKISSKLSTRTKKFNGLDTYLKRAKIKMYDDLIRDDEETYWILVSDEDEDVTTYDKKDPNIEKALNNYKVKYDEILVLELLIKNHVKVSVRRIGDRGRLLNEAVARAERASAKKEEKIKLEMEGEIQFLRDQAKRAEAEWQKRFEEAESSAARLELEKQKAELDKKAQAKLTQLRANFEGQINKAREDAEREAQAKIDQITQKNIEDMQALKDTMKESQELVAAAKAREKDLAEQLKKLSESIQDKQDATVLLALQEKPRDPITLLSIPEGKDKLLSQPLVVVSKTPQKDEWFKLESYQFSIFSPDGTELYKTNQVFEDVALGTPFSLEIPTGEKRLTTGSHEIQFILNYSYKNEPYSYKTVLGYRIDRPFPTWIFAIVLFIAVVVALALLIRWIFNRANSSNGINLTLTPINSAGSTTGRPSSYTLFDGNIISFDSEGEGDYSLNLNCPAYIVCEGETILLCKDDDENADRSLSHGETIQLTNKQGLPVFIKFEIGEELTEELSPESSEEASEGAPEMDSNETPSLLNR